MSTPISAVNPPYKKPPIIEAVIALHFSTPLEQKAIERFTRKRKDILPFSEDVIEMQGMFNAKTKQHASNIEKIGYKLYNIDRTHLVMIIPSSMAVSRLAPYTDWSTFYKEAREHWDALGHKSLSRVSTRYVNRIDIPVGINGHVDLHKYFNAGLSLPSYAETMALQTFHVSCTLLHSNKQFMNVLQLAATPSPLIDHMSFTIDIDVFTMEPVPSHEDKIWELINDLRQYKNEMFESCITPDTRALFQ